MTKCPFCGHETEDTVAMFFTPLGCLLYAQQYIDLKRKAEELKQISDPIEFIEKSKKFIILLKKKLKDAERMKRELEKMTVLT